MITLVRPVLQKAPSPMLVACGKIALVRLEQAVKALSLMVVTAGKLIVVRL